MPLESPAFDQAVSSAANPLSGMTSIGDAYQQALKMRQGALDIQKTYGEQQVGNALQQATDPTTGVLDTQKAQRIAAGMGPNAAFAMQGFLKTGSQLRGEQITQAGGLDTLTSGLAASAIADSSDENLARIRARGVAAGMPPSALAEIDRIAAIPDIGQRKLEAWKHLSGQMGASYNLSAGGYPTPVPTTFGGTTAPVTIQPRTPYGPGGMIVGGGVAHAPDPATYYGPQESTVWLDANGNETTDPTKVVRSYPRTGPRGPAFNMPPPGSVSGPGGGGSSAAPPPVPGAGPAPIPPAPHGTVVIQNGRIVSQPAAPAAPAAPPSTGGAGTYGGPGFGVLPPAPASAAPGQRSDLGGGIQVASANPSFAPSIGAAAPPSPAVAGDVNAITAGMNQARATPATGGTQTAFNAIQNGALATSPAPAPPAVTPAPPSAARPPPTAGVITGMPVGPEGDAATQHASEARAKTLTYQRDIQPIEGAITALSGADTGRASETLNSLRANIQDITPAFLQRMLPTSLTDPAARKAFEEANKYLTQMQLQAPGGARSDVGAAAAGAATPSVHISNAAAREVALAVLAQRRLEQSGTLLFNQSGKSGADFDRHMGAWVTQADPRAFVVDKMSSDERAAYVKGLGGTDTPAYQQFKRSYQDGVAAGVIPPPPAQQKRSFLAPAQPAQNPLMMTG